MSPIKTQRKAEDMPQNLYFVERIYTPIGGEQSFVTLIKANNGNEQRVRTVALNNRQLELRNHWMAQEGWFVYYDEEDRELPFGYGNRSAFAREQFKSFNLLQDQIIEESVSEETRDSVDLLTRFAYESDLEEVISYHVNVGHGNCSVILIKYDDKYELWMVDCSLSEKGYGTPFAGNLEACFDAIRLRLGLDPEKNLHISRFFLTHPHIDHYSGVEYLVNNGYIDSRTLCYWNYYYNWASTMYQHALGVLRQAGVNFIEPVHNNSQPSFKFLHPDCRIYRSLKTAKNLPGKYRIVRSPINNCSAVIKFRLAGKIMVFPGDLEWAGFKTMSGTRACHGGLSRVDYYAVSHHGSLNGHPIVPCQSKGGPCPSPLCCISRRLQKAILMGRDGAYPGIYHTAVKSYWGGLPGGQLIYTEKAKHFVELDWQSGLVTMI